MTGPPRSTQRITKSSPSSRPSRFTTPLAVESEPYLAALVASSWKTRARGVAEQSSIGASCSTRLTLYAGLAHRGEELPSMAKTVAEPSVRRDSSLWGGPS